MKIGGVRINVLIEEKSFVYATLWILTLSLSSAYFLSLSCGFMILVAFFGAIIIFSVIIENGPKKIEVPNFFHKWIPQRWHKGFSCQKCGERDCILHLSCTDPWKNIQVAIEIDTALEKTIDQLLQVYVYEWYTSISLDDELTQNLRLIIRYIAANLARRCSMLDLSALITNEITSCCLRHLDGVLRADEIAKSLPYGDVETMRKEFFDLSNINIHEALKSREHESEYLLDLSSCIVPYILPAKEIKCQSIRCLIEDLISGAVLQPIADITPNPDIVNHLLCLAFDSNHSKKLPEPSGVEVELLHSLVNRSKNNTSSSSRNNLKMDLSAILKNQSALFAFMKFLKEENAISSIQFCLTVEDFNKRIMDPHVNNEELDQLHSEAVNLFDTYLKRSSPHRVNVSIELVEEIRRVLMKPVADIVELRTTTPLFNAYEEVYNYLELEMCPSFHTSEEYFMFLLGKRTDESNDDLDKCGSRGWKDRLKSSLRKMSGKSISKSPIFYVSHVEADPEENDQEFMDCEYKLDRSSSSTTSSFIDITRVCALASLEDDDDDGISSSKSAEDLPKVMGPSKLENFLSVSKSRSLPRSSCLAFTNNENVLYTPNDTNHRRKTSGLSSFLKPVKALTNPIQNFLQPGTSFKKSGRSKSSHSSKGDKDKVKRVSSFSRNKMGDDGGEHFEPAIDLADVYDDDEEDGLRYSGVNPERRQEFRDLSAWRVSIPRLTAVSSSSMGKPYFVFVIDVQRIDMESKDGHGEDLHWNVKRRSSEFYALESKLTEFHGEFEDAKLPAKSKLFAGKGLDYLQAKQQPFEEYLAKLLQKPSLKESDLLYTFLTSNEEFTLAASKLGLGKMIKNVKLTKEKGQSLQPFIDSFIDSTRPGSPKPRLDCLIKELDSWEERKVKLHPLYGDNAERSLVVGDGNKIRKTFDSSMMENVQGVTDVFIYLALRVFHLNKWKLQLLMSLRLLVKNSLDHIVRYGIAYKLNQLLNSSRIAHLIKLIEDTIFCKEANPRTQKDKLDRQHLAQKKFQNFLHPYLHIFFGKESFESGTRRIFMALQDPVLNKQLFYQLLDVLVQKLFPEIQRQ
ncbi:sorting nexin-14 isoform X2 [Lepeophtheirus salmonis]|uniref:sorting nexin-14 isoform X2 n=1 Tax=Lepeophtheirus salmonis TaxID=72036 RepID=UPI001AE69BBE|nr:sorting nexin-14-like isoform X1 [Lepeophtheirus salmonis]